MCFGKKLHTSTQNARNKVLGYVTHNAGHVLDSVLKWVK